MRGGRMEGMKVLSEWVRLAHLLRAIYSRAERERERESGMPMRPTERQGGRRGDSRTHLQPPHRHHRRPRPRRLFLANPAAAGAAWASSPFPLPRLRLLVLIVLWVGTFVGCEACELEK